MSVHFVYEPDSVRVWLFGKNLCKEDVTVTPKGKTDAGITKIAFDIAAVTRTVQPAVYDLPGRHGAGSDILARQRHRAKVSADAIDAVAETVMPKRRPARQ